MFGKKYYRQYKQLFDNAPWYFRVLRFIFRVKTPLELRTRVILLYHEGKDAFIHDVATTLIAELKAFVHSFNPFNRVILGLNGLLNQCQKLFQAILSEEQQVLDALVKQRLEEAQRVSRRHKAADSTAELKHHLTEKLAFMKTIPAILPPPPMPEVFERYGKEGDITAITRVSTGKSMTYAHLMAEKKAALTAMESARECMSRKNSLHKQRQSEAFHRLAQSFHYENSGYSHHGFWEHKMISTASYQDAPDTSRESNEIDGCYGTIAYINRELVRLAQTTVPHVEISKETNKPKLSMLLLAS